MSDQTALADRLFGATMNTSEESAAGKIEAKKPSLLNPIEKPENAPAKPEAMPKETPTVDPEEHSAAINEVVSEFGYEANETTQSFSDFTARHSIDADAARELVQMQNDHTLAQWEAIDESWREASLAEFNQQDFDDAKSVLDRYGDDELKGLLEEYRLGSNPAIIRFVRNVARGR